jgi:hypothetical protein
MLDISDRIIWMEDGRLKRIARRDEVEIQIDTIQEQH